MKGNMKHPGGIGKPAEKGKANETEAKRRRWPRALQALARLL
jgi:hypothetical protein